MNQSNPKHILITFPIFLFFSKHPNRERAFIYIHQVKISSTRLKYVVHNAKYSKVSFIFFSEHPNRERERVVPVAVKEAGAVERAVERKSEVVER